MSAKKKQPSIRYGINATKNNAGIDVKLELARQPHEAEAVGAVDDCYYKSRASK